MSLVESKKRVADHGAAFTLPWVVHAMQELGKVEP